MVTQTIALDQETADRLSAEFHRCFSAFDASPGLFAPDDELRARHAAEAPMVGRRA